MNIIFWGCPCTIQNGVHEEIGPLFCLTSMLGKDKRDTFVQKRKLGNKWERKPTVYLIWAMCSLFLIVGLVVPQTSQLFTLWYAKSSKCPTIYIYLSDRNMFLVRIIILYRFISCVQNQRIKVEKNIQNVELCTKTVRLIDQDDNYLLRLSFVHYKSNVW